MKTYFAKPFLLLTVFFLSLTSCLNDLDRSPFYGLNSETVYSDPANYINVLAKLYAGLATTGNQGPAGQADISGIDEGFSSYLRILWNLNTVVTDEAIVGWNDPGLPDLHAMTWTPENPWISGMYYRIFFQIPLCNEFIRESSDEKMNERGFSDADQERIRGYRQEARFLRALSYYHALDLFGNVPFITEDDEPGSFFPEQISRADLFDYVEGELLEIESLLPAPMANEYGRADQAALWFVLSRMYLNAQVYTGSQRYADAVTYSQKVIDAGYTLQGNYKHLFLADNHLSPEVVFPITFDGLYTQTWGGTTFLVHAPVGGTMNPDDFGINGGWGGYRTTSDTIPGFGFANIVFNASKENPKGDTLDGRNLLYTNGQNMSIGTVASFVNGLAIAKFRNVTSDGVAGSDPQGNHVDTDFPMFRLGEAYLNYAEAVLRGGGGDLNTAASYINLLRERAYGNSTANIASGDLTLDFILNERGRELFWEGNRRIDLIRYGKFTGGSYLWPWKGGVKEGITVPDHLALYPIPLADIIANTNLTQNQGY